MGTIRLGTFPSTGNKIYQDMIAQRLLEWFISRFSPGFFNHIYLNTQNQVASSYIVNEQTGKLQKAQAGQKILQPALRMNVNQGRNNHDDVFGTIWNPNQQPGAFSIDTDMTGYKPFMYDPYGIILATNEYTIRNNFDININLQTKADQLSFFNYCDSNLKHLYVQVIPMETQVILPNLMMEYLRKCVFKHELDMLDKMVGDSEDKRNFRNRINERFNEYLYDFSNKCIKPYREQEMDNGVKNYTYVLNRTQYLTFKIEKPDGDEGTKKGGLYTSFSVSMSGWMEYANPISFITHVPAIIRGKKNDHFIRLSSETNYKGQNSIMEFKEVFKDERKKKMIDLNKWKKFYTEYEIMMSSVTENFNILDDVIDREDTPITYCVMHALLDFIESKEQFDELFKVHIYKNNEAISENTYSIDEKFNITIQDCDLLVPYYIDIYVNIFKYQNLMDKIIKYLYDSGLLLDKNGNLLFGMNMDTNDLYKMISQYMMHTKHNSIYGDDTLYLLVGSKYFWKYIHRRGWHYLTKNLEDNTFVPIKIEDFATASSEYDYYTLSVKNEYIPVTEEVVEIRDDLQFYFKDGDEYFAIDREQVLVPDPKYNFYIYDNKEHKFALCVNLKKFEKDKQYYILRDQHRVNEVLLNKEEME